MGLFTAPRLCIMEEASAGGVAIPERALEATDAAAS